MGKPKTLLEDICRHCLSIGAGSLQIESKDRHERVLAIVGGAGIQVAAFPSAERDAKELRENLYAAAKRPVKTVINGIVYLLAVRIYDSFGEDAFEVGIEPVPARDPHAPATYTAKQGQYLAFIYFYQKLHRCAPAETDMQQYFQVSPPSVNQMVQTLERNGLIRRTPGKGRSIELLVPPEYLPPLK